jgi:gamma-tubulin complex component 4
MLLLNEVVCALAGHPGEVFGAIDKDAFGSWSDTYQPASPESCPLKLVEEEEDEASENHSGFLLSSVMALGEKAVVNDLVKIGYHYREISRFATVESQPRVSTSFSATSSSSTGGGDRRKEGRGAYRRAFAFGLLKVLGEYRHVVLAIERRIKDEGERVPLTELQSAFCEYDALLQKLHRMVCTIAQRDLSGCQLLRFVEDYSVCGTPCVEKAMRVVAHYLYEVLYKQLASWLVYGRLVDKQREFFIQAKDKADKDRGCPSASSSSSSLESVSVEEYHFGFAVEKEYLPMHISEDTAATILFVGKSQRILSHARNNWRNLGISHDDNNKSNKNHGQSSNHSNSSAIILGKLEELYLKGQFSKPAFEVVVNSLRKDVAARMWQLVVMHADLPRHLQALKDYFLMERGNFYQVFLSEARSLMQKPPMGSTANAEVIRVFNQAAQRTGAEADPLFSNISVCMRNSNEEEEEEEEDPGKKKKNPKESNNRTGGSGGVKIHLPSLDGWDSMCMDYSVSWPLGLILTPDVLSKYHSMFQFLWRLRRVHVELDEVWSVLRRLAMRSPDHSAFSNSSQVWHLRNQIVHLICNLQIYVQVDVVETQYNALRKQIASAENFLDLEKALSSFLHTLITQSFLDISSITSMLDGIIKLCFKFCNSVHAQLENDNPLETLALFGRLQDDFQRRCTMLFTVLKSTKFSIASRAPHLHQFLLRLNYNEYIAKLAIESTTSGRW